MVFIGLTEKIFNMASQYIMIQSSNSFPTSSYMTILAFGSLECI
jgi:hypothetical protein